MMKAKSSSSTGLCSNGRTIITSMSDLPTAILIEIFLRLPLETILSSCKSVSKTWLRLLSDPLFAKLHTDRSAPTDVIVLRDPPPQRGDGTVVLYPCIGEDDEDSTVMVCSCNGLLLSRHSSKPILYVHNPAVRNKTIRIAAAHEGRDDEYIHTNFGIGYSSKSATSYKVVQITQQLDGSTEASVCVLGGCQHAALSWRRLRDRPPPRGEWWNHGGVFMDGAVYWFITDTADDGIDYVGNICCFDIETEQFRLLPPPPPLERFKRGFVLLWGREKGIWRLHDCGIRICLWEDRVSFSYCYFGMNDQKIWNVWVMKEYGVKESWSEAIIVQSDNMYDFYPVGRLFRDQILLTTLDLGGLFKYNHMSRDFKKLIERNKCFVEYAYLPSSLSPKHL